MAKQETKQEEKQESRAKAENKADPKSKQAAAKQPAPKQAASKPVAPKQSAPKIRIHLKGYDQRVLDASARDIVETAKRTGAGIAGPIPLPTTIEKYTVLSSPHVDKKSREQFEMREHKRLLIINKPTSKTVDALKGLNVPAGVDIKIKA